MQNPQNEIVQIVDRDNVVTGTAKRSYMRAKRLIHRATFILVFNDSNELFVQKRTDTKDVYPGHWDIAAGGVVLAGETYEESATRELAEELGVNDTPLRYCFDYYYEDPDNRVWGAVFFCRHNGPFQLQQSEIITGCFLSLDAVHALSEKEPFTPDGLEILRLFKDKEKL